MSHTAVATSKTPALIIYLLDCSASMGEDLDGEPKIEHVNRALQKVLAKMVQRSTKGEIVSPRYRVAMIAYSDATYDLLSGVKAIDEVVQKGTPTLSTMSMTNTEAAFTEARRILQQELPQLQGGDLAHPAPLVCHMTDGEFTGGDPEPVVQDIMQMSVDDGPVLVENIYLGTELTTQPIQSSSQWRGVNDPSQLSDPYVQSLFRMSSELPASYAAVLQEFGYGVEAGARMLIPGTNRDLVELAFTMSGATPVT